MPGIFWIFEEENFVICLQIDKKNLKLMNYYQQMFLDWMWDGEGVELRGEFLGGSFLPGNLGGFKRLRTLKMQI